MNNNKIQFFNNKKKPVIFIKYIFVRFRSQRMSVAIKYINILKTL